MTESEAQQSMQYTLAIDPLKVIDGGRYACEYPVGEKDFYYFEIIVVSEFRKFALEISITGGSYMGKFGQNERTW